MEGSIFDGLNKVFSNRLLQQYMAAMGQDIGSGNAIGSNVNQATQQNVAAQSQAATNKKTLEILAAMLRGDLPAGGSIKKSDKGDLSISLPSTQAGNMSVGEPASVPNPFRIPSQS